VSHVAAGEIDIHRAGLRLGIGLNANKQEQNTEPALHQTCIVSVKYQGFAFQRKEEGQG